jgi:hypothetical protein
MNRGSAIGQLRTGAGVCAERLRHSLARHLTKWPWAVTPLRRHRDSSAGRSPVEKRH